MSLLFDHAIGRFDAASSGLYAVGEGDLDPVDDPVPIGPIAEFATHHDALFDPDEEWTCLPLHAPGGAALSGEHVAYVDHPVRDEIVVFERDGERDALGVEAFGETRLARRLRFWHSDYRPAERPAGYEAPIEDREPPRNPVGRDVLEGFAEYVAAEREATRERNAERARNRRARTVHREGGDAIPAVEGRGTGEEGTYRFRVDPGPREREDWAFFVEQTFGVHEGNEVFLQAPAGDPDPPAAFPVPATVAKVRGLDLWLEVDWAAVDDAGAVEAALVHGDGPLGVVGRLNPVPFDREAAAVERLADHRLGDVVAGTRPVRFTDGAAARSTPFDDALNQEQALAAKFALLADDLFCVHGPPGTGKTRTLVEIVRRAVEAGEDVLVCTDSNQGLDNLVAGSSTRGEPDPRSLHAHGQHGGEEFVLDRLNAGRSRRRLVRERYGDVAGRADVVAATNSSAATTPRTFDLAVVDEATQSTCTASAIPLSRADRAVLAGDHRQLPPFSATEVPPESSYGLSLFEHLYADGGVYEGVGLQLKTQYRMHRDVAYFPNRAFYDRTLRNGRSVPPLDGRPALEGYNVGGEVEVVDHSRRNDAEARLTTHLVGDLLETLAPSAVGVITPYAAQVRRLREYLDAELGDDADGVTVDTIDAFQGSERTATVVSLVRSNADGALGFLGRPEDGPRRLNVALTRAQRYCAVVGDWHTLRYDAEGKCTELYREFYDHFENTGRLVDVDPAFLPVAELDG